MDRLGNYLISHEIGRGGMATVYQAEHQLLGTRVAVKVLNAEFERNENIRRRFLAEARHMAGMSHPGIVRVTDLVQEDSKVAFVMEFIEGQSLKDMLAARALISFEDVKSMLIQMLDALGHVHERDLVHRDIKPANFMIDRQNRIRLMDFGIAKNLDSAADDYTQTGTSQQMGTPVYMSPEQVISTRAVTRHSDIYSLGVVLWQMASGRRPYDGQTQSTFEIQTKIVQDPLPATGTPWDQIISRATQKDTANRYDTARQFAAEVAALNPETISDAEKTVIEMTPTTKPKVKSKSDSGDTSGQVKCPRCKGKGHVDEKDIVRLKRQNDWLPGPCAYCKGTGMADKEMVKSVPPDLLDLTHEVNENNGISPDYFFDPAEVSELLGELNRRLREDGRKSFLGNDIPDKKLVNFWSRFSDFRFSNKSSFYWYMDDTLFGKGDDGLGVMKTPDNKWFLLAAGLGDTPQAFELVHNDIRFNFPGSYKRLVCINGRGDLCDDFREGIDDNDDHLKIGYWNNSTDLMEEEINLTQDRKIIDALIAFWHAFPGNQPDFSGLDI